MSIPNALPNHLRPRREKIFGFARGFPHDRNARVRIEAYVMAWNAKHKQEGQSNQGPVTAAYQRVLHALLWHFTNYKTGLCFPSYETIAEQARCCRRTVYEAIMALEDTGVFSGSAHRPRRRARAGVGPVGIWLTLLPPILPSGPFPLSERWERRQDIGDGRFPRQEQGMLPKLLPNLWGLDGKKNDTRTLICFDFRKFGDG